jgi:putative ABC transport system substrate-binding protein
MPVNAKILVYAFLAVILATLHLAEAQESKKVPRIGYLAAAPLSAITNRIDEFRKSLRDLGYVEGKTSSLNGVRPREQEIACLRSLAGRVAPEPAETITSTFNCTSSAAEATATIPIVMTQDDDPIVNGFVASLARPGGNITGLSTLAFDLQLSSDSHAAQR